MKLGEEHPKMGLRSGLHAGDGSWGPRGGGCLPDLGSACTRALSQILTAAPPSLAWLCSRVMCGIICRRWGDGRAAPRVESGSDESIACLPAGSGRRMGFARSLGLYPLVFASAKALQPSASQRCCGTEEQTHPKPQLKWDAEEKGPRRP